MCDMTHSYMWHDAFTCLTWLIHTCATAHFGGILCRKRHNCSRPHHPCDVTQMRHVCDMTHPQVRHDSCTCVTWRIHTCDMTLWLIWLIHMCAMAHFGGILCRKKNKYSRPPPVTWLKCVMCVTWPINMRDITHLYVWHDAFICVTWRIHICDMTNSYVCRGSFVRNPPPKETHSTLQ